MSDDQIRDTTIATDRNAKVFAMISEVDKIITVCSEYEELYHEQLQKIHPDYRFSAYNLVHYMAYRSLNIKNLNEFLFVHGIIGLQDAREHLMPSVLAIRRELYKLSEQKDPDPSELTTNLWQHKKLRKKHAKELLGAKGKKRSVRIMVTQPVEALKNPDLMSDMIANGMDTVRINCAHDTPAQWLQLIENAKRIAKEKGKSIKITMDLAGPKIRTGAIAPGPQVLRIKPKRSDLGETVQTAKLVLFTENDAIPINIGAFAVVSKAFIDTLNLNDNLVLKDVRGKKRKLTVIEKTGGLVWCECQKSAYLQIGTKIKNNTAKTATKITSLPSKIPYLRLKKGDKISIHSNNEMGSPAVYDSDGTIMQHARISCTSPEIFKDVHPKEKVVFDDGKIEGTILENTGEQLLVEISNGKEGGTKLRADKGINFPNSKLTLSGLTHKDREDLKFAVRHVDVINMSFVNSAADVFELLSELQKLNAIDTVGVILKIETMQGFKNIVEILLAAMQAKPVGVMIARGDLAIECGWNNIGIVQEELLKICRSAHLPTIWATQVLENLAKKGIPSRAEITDAMMAQNADCVMLNKGPHIIEAISLLDTILTNVQKVRKDKRGFLKDMGMVDNPSNEKLK